MLPKAFYFSSSKPSLLLHSTAVLPRGERDEVDFRSTSHSTIHSPFPSEQPASSFHTRGSGAMARMDSSGTITQHQDGKEPFDIVKTYQKLLQSDPELTMPVAAIEALVDLLNSTPGLSTVSETLDILATSVATLKRSVANPISLSAGTDLFQRYLITTLRNPTQSNGMTAAGGDFKAIRQHLLNNGKLFVTRAKEARRTIAGIARMFVRDGSTVLTNGGSRVVGAVLKAAAEAQTREGGAPRFRVVYVASPATSYTQSEGYQTISALRAVCVPVATIPESAVAYSMGKVSMVMVGAEGVVENGGIISRMGTYQMAVLAKAAGKPFHVVAESHKFVRMFPLGQYDLGVDQRVLEFTTEDREVDLQTPNGNAGSRRDSVQWIEKTPGVKEVGDYFGKPQSPHITDDVSNGSLKSKSETVDYTPPDLITTLITEAGVHTPSAVSEELIKIWY